ncbi:MAG: CHRD domain-containing protein [Thermoproteota archaeon]|nr:CHRD domain-containing protein [Thermoproteota archaeon]
MSITKNNLAIVALLGSMLFVILTANGGLVVPAFANEDYTTNLSGDEEVPSVNTNAEGNAKLEVDNDKREIHFDVEAEGLEDIVGGHLHYGEKGENGPVVVTLFGEESTNNGNFEASGTIQENDLEGPLENKDISDLVEHIEDKEIYINIHTEQNPDGEIRGQFD